MVVEGSWEVGVLIDMFFQNIVFFLQMNIGIYEVGKWSWFFINLGIVRMSNYF